MKFHTRVKSYHSKQYDFASVNVYAILKDDDNNDDYATDEDNIGDNVNNVAKCKVWQSQRSQERDQRLLPFREFPERYSLKFFSMTMIWLIIKLK